MPMVMRRKLRITYGTSLNQEPILAIREAAVGATPDACSITHSAEDNASFIIQILGLGDFARISMGWFSAPNSSFFSAGNSG
jgi:hypothetical protein